MERDSPQQCESSVLPVMCGKMGGPEASVDVHARLAIWILMCMLLLL
jgi:hypothetical protein